MEEKDDVYIPLCSQSSSGKNPGGLGTVVGSQGVPDGRANEVKVPVTPRPGTRMRREGVRSSRQLGAVEAWGMTLSLSGLTGIFSANRISDLEKLSAPMIIAALVPIVLMAVGLLALFSSCCMRQKARGLRAAALTITACAAVLSIAVTVGYCAAEKSMDMHCFVPG